MITLPTPWLHQKKILTSKAKNRLLITGRRTGKTYICGSYLILQALDKVGEYWWVAPDLNQARVIIRIMKKWLINVCEFKFQEKCFALPNGSNIRIMTAENEKALRGEGLCGCVVDEAADIKESIVMECIMPALEDNNGWLVLASTPKGYNWLWDFYNKIKSNPDWFVLECPSSASPILNIDRLNAKKAIMGEARWNQEYGGKFCAHGDALFKAEWFKDILIEKMPENYKRKMIACDLSLGYLHSDYQAVCFLGYQNNIFHADILIERQPLEILLDNVKYMYEKYKPEGVIFETNGFQVLAAHAFEKKFVTPPVVFQQYNSIKKETRISRLSTLLSRGELKILNNVGGQMLLNQLRDFPSKDVHDDGPDAVEMAWRGMIET